MIQIRPISDLQNDYNSIEKELLTNKQQTIYLTKDGYGSTVIMSLENYSKLTDQTNKSSSQLDKEKEEHIEIISRPKKVVIDEDDE